MLCHRTLLALAWFQKHFLFSLVDLVSVYYMMIHTGLVAALTLSQFGSLVPLLEQDVCLCS